MNNQISIFLKVPSSVIYLLSDKKLTFCLLT